MVIGAKDVQCCWKKNWPGVCPNPRSATDSDYLLDLDDLEFHLCCDLFGMNTSTGNGSRMMDLPCSIFFQIFPDSSSFGLKCKFVGKILLLFWLGIF